MGINAQTGKPTVSIGIPAHNEEQNIGYLLNALLQQSADNYRLTEIIVIADGCTDNTTSIVNGIQDKRIKLINLSNRKGKPSAQNRMVNEFESEYLLLLDADILPQNNHFIDSLVEAALVRPYADLTCCRFIPLDSGGPFEKALAESARFVGEVAAAWDNGNNVYTCHGRCRLISRRLAGQLDWTNVTAAEDAYTYIMAISKGFIYRFTPNAGVLYRCPTNFRDHARQSQRFTTHSTILAQTIGSKDQYRLPTMLTLKVFTRHFVQHPVRIATYLAIQVRVKLTKPISTAQGPWDMAVSTKKLN